MKRVTYSVFPLIASLMLVSAQPRMAVAQNVAPETVQETVQASDPSVCIDGMETAPGSDDLEPILAAADAGCSTPQGPVSI